MTLRDKEHRAKVQDDKPFFRIKRSQLC